MWERKRMPVNELLSLLIDHYECNTAVIKSIEVAGINKQGSPAEMKVDTGGVLTLYIDVYKEPFGKDKEV